MRSETIAIHSGYVDDPTTKAVAVPIYQTVAYSFDSADHGAALFNLETEGFRYSRISNPTTSVLERRVTELEGGLQALAVSTGQAALRINCSATEPSTSLSNPDLECVPATIRSVSCCFAVFSRATWGMCPSSKELPASTPPAVKSLRNRSRPWTQSRRFGSAGFPNTASKEESTRDGSDTWAISTAERKFSASALA